MLISSLIVSACSTAQYRTELLTSISEADRERCEQLAQSEAGAIKDDTASTATGALLASLLFAKGAPFAFVLFGIPEIISEANKVSKARTEIYDQTIKECLEPTIIEANFGPEEPDLARSLVVLADRYKTARKYAEAEPLYRRAVAIQEKVLGPEHPDVANTLEAYASVLSRMDRQSEAEEVAARYLSIRNKHPHKQLDDHKGALGQATTQAGEISSEKMESESEKTSEAPR
jgi:hypothetical protein